MQRIKLGISCQLHTTKSMEGRSFHNYILKSGNNNTKHLPYTALVRPILEYGAVCLHPCRESQVSALNRGQKRAANLQII
jgi:hypothetical protein